MGGIGAPGVVGPGPLRVCFFGDSFLNGTGDDACLGRACAAAPTPACNGRFSGTRC